MKKAKLLVDLSKLRGEYCGLWEFSRRLGQALIECIDHERWSVTFLVPRSHPFTDSRVRYLRLRWWHRYLLQFCRYDVLHGLVQNTPYLRHKNRHNKYVITLHDLNFLHERPGAAKEKRYLHKYQSNIVGLDALVFISHFAARDAKEHLSLGSLQTTVIYNGVAERLPIELPSVPPGLEARLQGREFLLLISTFMRKKNIHVLVDMMKYLPDLCLVVAGRVMHHDYFEEVTKTLESAGLGSRVFMIGAVSDAEKYWLFDNSKAFVFPSLAEGFGIPPIESMRAGKPVFASRSTSIPEICGDMAFYWDTLEGKAMAEVVKRSLSDQSAPQNDSTLLKKYADKYSWKTCASEYIKVYEGLISQK